MTIEKTGRGRRAAIATASGLAIAAASLTVGMPAATAATSVTGFGPGTIGTPQLITMTEICNQAGVQLTFQAQYSDGTISSAPSVTTDSSGSATVYWTPPKIGTVSQVSVGSTCSPVSVTSQFQISQVGTLTTISAPNTAKVGQQTRITINVQSNSPSTYTPAGSVVVKDANGATLQTMVLTPSSGSGQSFAYYYWTPSTAGQYIIQATYQPSDGNAAGSTSAQDIIQATPSGGTISLKAPGTLTQGVPVTLTATVVPASVQGSVGFTLNGNAISAAIPIVNGVANFTWTPNVAGQVTLGANYTTAQGGSGSTSDVVNIASAPAQGDNISLVQPGWGPWTPNGTYTLGNGSNFTFQATSLSGSPVTLSETGPCQVSGLNISVPVGSGVCNVKASTAGGNGYAPVTVGYTVNLIPGVQTATLAAPPSGRFKVGRVLVLEAPGQADTSAGQNIGWNIQKKGSGRKHCTLLYPDNGSVTLRITSKGSCTVVGSAPGVAGQWQPFKTARNYTGR